MCVRAKSAWGLAVRRSTTPKSWAYPVLEYENRVPLKEIEVALVHDQVLAWESVVTSSRLWPASASNPA